MTIRTFLVSHLLTLILGTLVTLVIMVTVRSLTSTITLQWLEFLYLAGLIVLVSFIVSFPYFVVMIGVLYSHRHHYGATSTKQYVLLVQYACSLIALIMTVLLWWLGDGRMEQLYLFLCLIGSYALIGTFSMHRHLHLNTLERNQILLNLL